VASNKRLEGELSQAQTLVAQTREELSKEKDLISQTQEELEKEMEMVSRLQEELEASRAEEGGKEGEDGEAVARLEDRLQQLEQSRTSMDKVRMLH
jgi:predicted  nucleic acid-binding Zn-ribbon protein